MYKKYMHSNNRVANPTVVNEGLISWAKGKLDALKKKREENIAKRKAQAEQNMKSLAAECIEDQIKAGGQEPEAAVKKAKQLAKKVINKPEFKELKPLFKDSGSELNAVSIDEFKKFEAGEFYLCFFDFKTPCRSEAENKWRFTECGKFADALEKEYQKTDKTYTFNTSQNKERTIILIYIWNDFAEKWFG